MKSLKILLFCGASYFLLVAFAHAAGLKIPGLFVYFNVPSYAYQNTIISSLAFGWSALFFVAASNPSRQLIKSIILIGAVALIMFSYINISTNFAALGETIHPKWFHVQVIVLFIYWLSLLRRYAKARTNGTI